MIYSKQREGILRTFRYELNHPTAEELYTHLKEREPSLSLATVYRNLNQLSKIGKVMRIEVPNGSDRFDSIADGHYHLICEKCGKAVDIARDAIPDTVEAAQKYSGCEVKNASILFCGICRECKNK